MNWLESITAEAHLDKAPRGFYSAKQVAAIKNISLCRAGELLRKQCDAGNLIIKKVRIKTGGKIYPVPHYGPP